MWFELEFEVQLFQYLLLRRFLFSSVDYFVLVVLVKNQMMVYVSLLLGCPWQVNVHESEQTLGGGEGQGSWCAAVHGAVKSWT